MGGERGTRHEMGMSSSSRYELEMGGFLINHVEQVETGRFVQALSALLHALHDLHGWT